MGCLSGSGRQKQQSMKDTGKNSILEGTKIFTDKHHKAFVEKQILNRMAGRNGLSSYQFDLVFRASQAAYSAKNFHRLAHGAKDSLLLVRTKNGSIFGGYTCCEWKDEVKYLYEIDQQRKSFLFRVALGKKKQLNSSRNEEQQPKQDIKADIKESESSLSPQIFSLLDKEKAVMNNEDMGPVFGKGFDLFIANQCNQNESWANIGRSYSCPYKFASNKANECLAGQPRFLISEYQLWKMVQVVQKDVKNDND